ncbi:TetR/AcrR family transcriptional regulator [Winogradskya consettensis]|uniref:TetR family transcriptional regulator n=1 Tax=Winogradskya consettensis TaxID=113560 RepID=A0A919T292_9ACTN|nr:TetR/AcrR family transcriptional regulator [Actinoplanes consettensis]GIM82236.1 TetR family transcriptional regulator [Actinoplanes consettensis]
MPSSNRSTAAARRQEVLDAAVSVFAERGYHGASVQEVARRAAISEPYVYRLFGNREQLFTAAIEQAFELISHALGEASQRRGDASPQQLLDAMAERYIELIADGRLLRVQLHAQAAAAAEPAIQTVVRAAYRGLVTDVSRWSGAADGPVQMFFARGMLCHLVVSIGVEDDQAPWVHTLAAGIRH